MTSPAGGLKPRFARTPHLVALVAEVERFAALVRGRGEGSVADELRSAAVLASLRLDGSPIEAPPQDLEAGPGVGKPQSPDGAETAGWLDAFRGRDAETDVLAAEYAGVAAGLGADDLAGRLLLEPVAALAELHRRLTAGLLAREIAGRPRTTRQAVHDSSTGRVLFHAEDPRRIPSRLALLGGWLTSAAAREHALVVSGIIHHELLEIHPFEAANGRLARTAARLTLRGRDLDPDGLAVAEISLEEDPLSYYEEVPATVRRRDLTVWLERWGEAVAAGLRESARRLRLLDADPPERAVAFLEQRSSPDFTVVDYRAGVGVGPEEARRHVEALLDAGRVRRVPGSRGLRLVVS